MTELFDRRDEIVKLKAEIERLTKLEARQFIALSTADILVHKQNARIEKLEAALAEVNDENG